MAKGDNVYDELKTYLKIDKFRLDDEMIQQPELYHMVASDYAEVVAIRDAAKEELKSLHAELYAEKREELAGSSERVTEGMVTNAVLTDKKYLKSQRDLIDAEEQVGKMQALKDAFQQRSYMLRELASLYIAGYFGKDSVTMTGDQNSVRAESSRRRMTEARNEKRKGRERL